MIWKSKKKEGGKQFYSANLIVKKKSFSLTAPGDEGDTFPSGFQFFRKGSS